MTQPKFKKSDMAMRIAPAVVALLQLIAAFASARSLSFGRALIAIVFFLGMLVLFELNIFRRQYNFPGWLFATLMLLNCEMMLQFWTYEAFSLERLVVIALFGLAHGLLFSLFSTIGRSPLASRIVAIVLSVLYVSLYFAEYLMWDAFAGAFLGLDIIESTGTAAVDDFGDNISRAIFGEFWRLFLLLLPVIVYGILGWRFKWGRAANHFARLMIAVVAVVSFGLGYLATAVTPLAANYKKAPLQQAVNLYGLPTALRLDKQQLKRDLEFMREEPAPTSTMPTQWDGPMDTDPVNSDEPVDPSDPAVTLDPMDPLGLRPKPSKAYNMLDIDFDALEASESNSEIAKLHGWVASRQPTATNAFTGLFKGKNLIFITAEAFSKEVIDPELTPALYRLATQGIEFTDYYQPAWGGSTSTGEYSNITGLVPVGSNIIHDTIGLNMYYTIANRLNAEGYTSIGYHNNTYTYYDRDETHPGLGYTQWIGMGNGMEEGVEKVWPASDKQMIDYTMDLYLDKQPFSIYYMSVSGHGLYSRQGNTMSYRNYDAVKDLDYSETVKCYLAANLELEYAMEDLLARLEREGMLNDTVIVLGTDHYPYCLEKSTTWGNDRDYLSDLYGYEVTNCVERDHSQLILWCGCLEGKNIKVTTPTYSLDILPTLLNLFGVDYESRMLVGRDVFSDAEPVVLWNDYSWKTEKGVYLSRTGKFTPAPGVTVEDGYVERISNTVANRINYSRGVIRYDYYDVVFGDR